MTAGNNGAGTPENDDPFAYLYRSEGGDGGADGAASDGSTAQYGRQAPQPGVPRTSYNQVRRVGERQYGGQQSGYGYPQQQSGYGYPQAQSGYGYPQGHASQQPGPGHPQSPNPAYAAPETLPGGAPRRAPQSGHGGGGRGPNSKGLLIGAIAVVAVVVIGIVAAMAANGDDGTDGSNEADSSPSAPADSGDQQQDPVDDGKDKDKKKPFSSDKEDAAELRLGGGATVAKDVPNARSDSGAYVAGMNKPGATATWKVDVPKKGPYTLFVGYGVPGEDAGATLMINGKKNETPLKLKNWSNAGKGEWDKGWSTTYNFIQLPKGTNTLDITCAAGDKCNFNLDWVQLKAGHVEK